MSRVGERLSLDQEGWSTVDKASTRVHGAADAIIEEMQQVVNEGVVVSLCKEIGICSAAFLFHDHLKKYTRFYRDKEPSPTYRTKYLWKDSKDHEEWSDLIHWLFVQVRESQYSDPRRADYYAHLPVDEVDSAALPCERIWRAEYGVHYCSAGEMIFTLFAWRLLSCCVALGKASEEFDSRNLTLAGQLNTNAKCEWAGAILTEDEHAPDILSSLWGSRIGPQQSWSAECSSLLLDRPDIRKAVANFLELSGFASTIAVGNDSDCYVHFSNAVPEFVQWLYPTQRAETISEALRILERAARFPVLPFYAWITLNESVVCYSVVPIWTSQNHAVTFPHGPCRHLGLALTAVEPVSAWDMTISSGNKCDPRVLINFLRLMSRPLVETNLYHFLFEQIADDLNSSAKRVIESFSKTPRT